MQLFDIIYTVPYEGECTIHDCLVEEVLAWIQSSPPDYTEYARLVPTGQIWYDSWNFVHTFGKA